MSDIRRYTPSEFISLDEEGEFVKYEDHRSLLDAKNSVIDTKNARIAEFAERHLKDFEELEVALQGQRVLAHEVELLVSALEACLDYGGMTGADWVHDKAETALAVVRGK